MAQITLAHDNDITIAVGDSRTAKVWKNQTLLWSVFLEKISATTRTRETVAEYRKMSKVQQDERKDCGGYVGGWLKQGKRKADSLTHRSLITLDADFATTDLFDDFELFYGNAAAVYSTHKHTPDSPRLRLIVPLTRTVDGDEYQAVSRKLAEALGIDQFDDTTYQPTRLMYWPSTSQDGEYQFKYCDGPFLNPDSLLALYPDWRDTSYWPESSRSVGIRKATADKQGNPLEKPGVIGAFCQCYDIESAIAKFLTDKYTACDAPNRYTFTGGSTAAGLVVYDNGLFAYSNHATDPASGRLCNAFDLVRLHLFGEADEDSAQDTPINRLPSYTKMTEFAISDAQVKNALAKTTHANAVTDFTDTDETVDEFPFIVAGRNGAVKVDTALLAQDFRDRHKWFLTKGSSGGVSFWVYDGKIYKRMSESQLKGEVVRRVETFDPRLVKTRDANEVYSLLCTDDNYRSLTELNADENRVVFENGIYHIATGVLSPHTPDYIGTVMLPLNWNADAPAPAVFNSFLYDLTGGDEEKRQFLLEFFGVTLSNIPGYKTKKALFLVGEGNTGKSQIRTLIERLLGDENCASVDLATLEQRFGTGLVFGKRLVGSNDLSFTDIPELKIFKQLTGGDTVLMENKYADGFTGRFDGVMWFSMNRLPSFGGDQGTHVLDRIVIIECGAPVPAERRDEQLLDKLYAEREGIVKTCLEAARRVQLRGCKYTIPEASTLATTEYEADLSSTKMFIRDHCVSCDIADGMNGASVYSAYGRWCYENGYKQVSRKTFTRDAAEWLRMSPAQFSKHKKDGAYYAVRWTDEGRPGTGF